jgi:hypothetical protein
MLIAIPGPATAAQRVFYLFQSPNAESIAGDIATNAIVTLTHSNASGTISNAIFSNSVTVTPSGQGVRRVWRRLVLRWRIMEVRRHYL